MRNIMMFLWLLALTALRCVNAFNLTAQESLLTSLLTPKIMIVNMFEAEALAFRDNFISAGFSDLSSHQYGTQGLSMRYPQIHCTADNTICQVVTGEGEINAASTISALVLSPYFDLRETYFLITGIAGVNPRYATTGSVAIAQWAVQVALQHEIDPRDMDPGVSSGYIPYGRNHAHEYPSYSYGTEVFQLNGQLRDMAYYMAQYVPMEDNPESQRYRAMMAGHGAAFVKGTEPPSVVKCDVATSDVWFSGMRLANAFEDISRLWTNGSATYCMTAQEDNASLEVLVRGHLEGLVDFHRIMILRTGSNFDRAPVGVTEWQHVTRREGESMDISLKNLVSVSAAVIRGITENWDATFKAGVPADHYVGDILGSLGGYPSFGYSGPPTYSRTKRS